MPARAYGTTAKQKMAKQKRSETPPFALPRGSKHHRKQSVIIKLLSNESESRIPVATET